MCAAVIIHSTHSTSSLVVAKKKKKKKNRYRDSVHGTVLNYMYYSFEGILWYRNKYNLQNTIMGFPLRTKKFFNKTEDEVEKIE
jgi:hypothetical protein